MSEVPPELDSLHSISDPLERRLRFTAILTQALGSDGAGLVLVGGQALQFYTAGAYATADIDLVCPAREEAAALLAKWGFTREGRHWRQQALELLVEIPGLVLAGDPSRVTEVQVGDLTLRVIGPEDLIADRLRAAVHWHSDEDRFWASSLITTNRDTLDWDYLRRQAEKDGTAHLLAELEAQSSA
jgi:hypothetical protein